MASHGRASAKVTALAPRARWLPGGNVTLQQFKVSIEILGREDSVGLYPRAPKRQCEVTGSGICGVDAECLDGIGRRDAMRFGKAEASRST